MRRVDLTHIITCCTFKDFDLPKGERKERNG